MSILAADLDWPDVELIVADYLRAGLATSAPTAKVGSEVPRPHGSSVRVQRVGGQQGSVWDDARIVSEYWADKKSDAFALAKLGRELMRQIPGTRSGWLVVRASETGLAYLPDAESGTPRYVLTNRVAVRTKLRAS